jgi:hypothetical protein
MLDDFASSSPIQWPTPLVSTVACRTTCVALKRIVPNDRAIPEGRILSDLTETPLLDDRAT